MRKIPGSRHAPAAAAVLLAAVAAQLAAFGPPKEKSSVDLVRAKFDEMKAGISTFNSLVGPYVESSVQEEILRIEWDEVENDKQWSCLPTLERIRDSNKAKQDAVNKAAKQASTAWKGATGTANKQKIPADQLPWKPEEFKPIGDAIKALGYFDSAIDSAKTSKGSRMSDKLVAKATQYATALPDSIGKVDLDRLVPPSVQVPCVSRSVGR